jgi:hypothetical protein
LGFRRPHQPAQTAVRLQPVEIVETLTPGKVQQEQRRHHLPIAPALGAAHRDVPRHRLLQPGRPPQLQIQRKPRKTGESRFARFVTCRYCQQIGFG